MDKQKKRAIIIAAGILALVWLVFVVEALGELGRANGALDRRMSGVALNVPGLPDIWGCQLDVMSAKEHLWGRILPVIGGPIYRIVSGGARRELEETRRKVREIEETTRRFHEETESKMRDIQLRVARLNNAGEAEIMQIEQAQRDGGADKAQAWIDGYQNGRLGKLGE